MTTDPRSERAHDLADRRRKDVDAPDDEHVVRSPDAPHARAGTTAFARRRPDLDVIPRAEPQERGRAVLKMRQHELARGAIVHLDDFAGLGLDQLGVHEPASAQMHAVLLLALPRATRRCRRCPSPR